MIYIGLLMADVRTKAYFPLKYVFFIILGKRLVAKRNRSHVNKAQLINLLIFM